MTADHRPLGGGYCVCGAALEPHHHYVQVDTYGAAPELSAAERATVARFDAAPVLPESAEWVRAMLGLAEELDGNSERAYQRSCRAYRDEFSDGQHHAYEDAADGVRTTVATVLAADPEPREDVVEAPQPPYCGQCEWDGKRLVSRCLLCARGRREMPRAARRGHGASEGDPSL